MDRMTAKLVVVNLVKFHLTKLQFHSPVQFTGLLKEHFDFVNKVLSHSSEDEMHVDFLS